MERFNAACDFVSQWVYQNCVFGQYSIHHALYREIRSRFDLSAQLANGVLGKVCDAYKTERTLAQQQQRNLTVCRFQSHAAIVYDARLVTYREDNILTIRTLYKRRKMAFQVHDQERFAFRKGEADLVYDNGAFFLLQTCEVPEPEPLSITDTLGVDLGIRHLAYDSDGNPYTHPGIEQARQKYERRRTTLKQKKTKNARRRLKRLGRKERRFRSWVNHNISKQLVAKAKDTSRGLALEALRQFFTKTTVRKSHRAQRSSWAFRQLREYISYKARLSGVPVFLVDPAYTSQECSQCHHIAKVNRPTMERFCCQGCGYTADADHNASQTIRFRAAINLPELCNIVAEGDAATNE